MQNMSHEDVFNLFIRAGLIPDMHITLQPSIAHVMISVSAVYQGLNTPSTQRKLKGKADTSHIVPVTYKPTWSDTSTSDWWQSCFLPELAIYVSARLPYKVLARYKLVL